MHESKREARLDRLAQRAAGAYARERVIESVSEEDEDRVFRGEATDVKGGRGAQRLREARARARREEQLLASIKEEDAAVAFGGPIDP